MLQMSRFITITLARIQVSNTLTFNIALSNALILRWHTVYNSYRLLCVINEPQNLYFRDDKFHATFETGTEKRRFSVPLLMTKMHQIAQICNYIFKNFPGIIPRTGATENAGLENDGPSKSREVENAGLEFGGPNSRAGKCRSGKCRTGKCRTGKCKTGKCRTKRFRFLAVNSCVLYRVLVIVCFNVCFPLFFVYSFHVVSACAVTLSCFGHYNPSCLLTYYVFLYKNVCKRSMALIIITISCSNFIAKKKNKHYAMYS